MPAAASASPSDPVEVGVKLAAPSPAAAVQNSRVLTAHAKAGELDVRSPYSVSYIRELATLQAAAVTRIARAVPGVTFRWRYRIVLDGVAVVVPRDRLNSLSK